MKGIILAGGTGTRLYPATIGISKQLIPIYDKPMIYYPLTTLMLAGIKEILIITTKFDLERFKTLLGNGKKWGISIEYVVQKNPNGIAEAFILAEDFIKNHYCALILGDNLFFGFQFQSSLLKIARRKKGATIFAYRVKNPGDYGVVSFKKNKVTSIIEKPNNPKSNYAVTGLYFYDKNVSNYAKKIKPSKRGELEISSINNIYLKNNSLKVEILGRGMAWLDTGTHDSLLDASHFVQTLEKRQGTKIASPEEVAYRKKWISKVKLKSLIKELKNNQYSEYLLELINE